MADVGTLYARLTLDPSGVGRGVAAGKAQLRGLQGTMGAVAQSGRMLTGVLAGVAGSIGAMMIFKSVVSAGTEFNYVMETVGGISRATGEEFEALSARAREMGETTEFTATQAAEALRFLSLAGFSASESIAALPGVLDLATAGATDLGRAADIAASSLRAFQLDAEDLGRVNDVLVGTFTRSNTTLETLSESMKYSAPLAKAYGYSIEELSGMIGVLGDAGIQGSMAGTQLAMAMQRANDVAQEFGYESSDLIDVLQSMREEGRTNADIMQEFGIRAGRAALILADQTEKARGLQSQLYDVRGEAERLADRMRGTVKGSFQELKSVIESVSIDAFDKFKDSLKDAITDLTAFIRENKDAIVNFITILSQVTLGLVQVVAFVGRSIVSLLKPFTSFFDSMQEDINHTTAAIMGFGVASIGALIPPQPTQWEIFWTSMKRHAHNFANELQTVLLIIGEVIDFVIRAGETLTKIITIETREFMSGPFGTAFTIPVPKFDARALDELKSEWKNAGADIVDAWNEGVADADYRSAEQIIADRMAADRRLQEEAEKERKRLLEARKNELQDFYKEVIATTTGGEEGTDPAQQIAQRMQETAQVWSMALKGMKADAADFNDTWRHYVDSQLQLMDARAEAMVQAGIEEATVNAFVAASIRELEETYNSFFNTVKTRAEDDSEKVGESMDGWVVQARDAAQSMSYSFETLFFDVIRNEMKTFFDYMKMLADDLARYVSRKLSEAIFGTGGFLDQALGFAPAENVKNEVYIQSPMPIKVPKSSEMSTSWTSDPENMRDFGAGSSRSQTVINMNISTPDVRGFQESRTQILNQTMVALEQHARRNRG